MIFKEYIEHNLWMLGNRSGLTRLLSAEAFAKLQYRAMTGKRLRLDNPVDFNEKVQWLKLHYRNPLMIQCADKFEVRKFVQDRIGDKYLGKMIGVYDNADDIPFELLPNRFVIKATHGSGWNIICPDKANIDWHLAIRKMRRWLKSDYSRNGREWQYREIKPRLICEEFLSDSDGSALKDYKMLTFRGETKYIWVDSTESLDSENNNIRTFMTGYSKPKIARDSVRCRNIYNCEWQLMDNVCLLPACKGGSATRKPECLAEMIEVAKKLACDFPQCRVDLYVIDGKKIVFGELTFTSDNGCSRNYTQNFNDELGSYIDLPKITA